jgi:hypothetical protein
MGGFANMGSELTSTACLAWMSELKRSQIAAEITYVAAVKSTNAATLRHVPKSCSGAYPYTAHGIT